MLHRYFKDLPTRAASCKVLLDEIFATASIAKYDGQKRDLGSIVYKDFDKKSAIGAIKSDIV